MPIDPTAPPPRTAPERTAQHIADLNRQLRAAQSRYSALAAAMASPTFHVVGAAGEPALTASWDAFPGSTVRFWKDPLGIVHLSGTVQHNVATATHIVFVLPKGFRPFADGANWVGENGNPLPIVGVSQSGDVSATCPTEPSKIVPVGFPVVHLDSVMFFAGS